MVVESNSIFCRIRRGHLVTLESRQEMQPLINDPDLYGGQSTGFEQRDTDEMYFEKQKPPRKSLGKSLLHLQLLLNFCCQKKRACNADQIGLGCSTKSGTKGFC